MESVNNTIINLISIFTGRMDKFEREHQLTTPDVPATTSSLAAEFAAFREFIISALTNLQQQVRILNDEADKREMRSRKRILLLHGVPEEKSEDPVDIVVRIATTKLGAADFKKTSVSQCHRLGVVREDKPRPLLVQLCSDVVRNEIWYAKTKLKGTGIAMSEFLTKTRHSLFMAVRSRVGVSKCWTHGGQICVLGPDGKKRLITTLADLGEVTGDGVTPGPSSPSVVTAQSTDGKTTKSKRRIVPKK